MLDSFGRVVRYLRVSVTDRCNLRCVYCMPEEGVPFIPHERILSLERIALVVKAAAGLGFDKIRLTGGEPLSRKGLPELVSMISAIPGITTIGMTTNGTMLAPLAAELRERGLSSVNVSLDTLDPKRFAAITRGGRLDDAVAGILAARAAGLPVKLNVVCNDESLGANSKGDASSMDAAPSDEAGSASDVAAVRAFALANGCAVQTIRRYRLDQEKLDDERYERPSPCSLCDRIRLLSTGELRPCLHGDYVVPVDFNDIESSISACVALKPACGAHTGTHLVSAIGG